jgi:hypothetical protein
MNWVLPFVLLCHAGAPLLERVRPVAAPWDVVDQYAEWSEKAGQHGTIHCDEIWADQVRLCFRIWEGKSRRWMLESETAAAGIPLKDLRGHVLGQGPRILTGLERVPVEGMPHAYWQLRDGDGWAVLGALQPGEVARLMGASETIHMALPAQGVLVAWAAGTPELDHVMAVGVREMYEQIGDAVSPMIHTWDGENWSVFGEAKSVPTVPNVER